MDDKRRAFTRFIVSIICNNCGLNGVAQLSWQPEQRLAAKCFRCGDAEVVFVGQNASEHQSMDTPTPDITLSPDELEIVREIAAKRKRERESN